MLFDLLPTIYRGYFLPDLATDHPNSMCACPGISSDWVSYLLQVYRLYVDRRSLLVLFIGVLHRRSSLTLFIGALLYRISIDMAFCSAREMPSMFVAFLMIIKLINLNFRTLNLVSQP